MYFESPRLHETYMDAAGHEFREFTTYYFFSNAYSKLLLQCINDQLCIVEKAFVSLAQVFSPPAVQDLDLAEPNFIGLGIDLGYLSSASMHGHNLDPIPENKAWDSQSADGPHPWALQHSSAMLDSLTNMYGYNSSSRSTSPSPPGSVHQEQHQKRRQQNRAAQRAYRDRKTRHLVDLQNGIRDIEHKISRLQKENTGLIRELCDLRTENNDLRQRPCENTNSGMVNAGANPGSRKLRSKIEGVEPHSKQAASAKADEFASLYGPFAAMWNLIQLDPAVVQGDVSAATLLDCLRTMVDFDDATTGRKAAHRGSATNIADTPAAPGGDEDSLRSRTGRLSFN
ncbi:hypothetical protein LTR37_021364 [Vermiconidia calcicola]|uniref:Uncharacterized protein n=1 Tax=Vermiconidia calcicola TaxID=1690605 RepID=A0ACC3MBR7_9PEZI|nr:hypothetical protein LTR37_021364 [Vermiconidia calcicola]